MKYVIDVGEKFTNKDGEVLYRVKGFKSLVFDDYGLERLTPYDKSKAYLNGYKQGQKNCEDELLLNRTALKIAYNMVAYYKQQLNRQQEESEEDDGSTYIWNYYFKCFNKPEDEDE